AGVVLPAVEPDDLGDLPLVEQRVDLELAPVRREVSVLAGGDVVLVAEEQDLALKKCSPQFVDLGRGGGRKVDAVDLGGDERGERAEFEVFVGWRLRVVR